jgi:hypothetical protein
MTIQEKYRLHLKSLSDELLALQKPIRILDAIKWPRHLQSDFLASGGGTARHRQALLNPSLGSIPATSTLSSRS